MALTFPNVTNVQNIFTSGQDYALDNYSKTVTLYYSPSISGSDTYPGSGNLGNNVMPNGASIFDPLGDFLANSGQNFIQVQETGTINLICSYNPQNIGERFKKDPDINVQYNKELTYIYCRGYMADYLKVVKAEYAVFDIPGQTTDPMKFRLASQPRDKNSLVQGRYFNCWWEQIP